MQMEQVQEPCLSHSPSMGTLAVTPVMALVGIVPKEITRHSEWVVYEDVHHGVVYSSR